MACGVGAGFGCLVGGATTRVRPYGCFRSTAAPFGLRAIVGGKFICSPAPPTSPDRRPSGKHLICPRHRSIVPLARPVASSAQRCGKTCAG